MTTDTRASRETIEPFEFLEPLAQIVLFSHGDLACALKRTAEIIAGPQMDVTCLALMPGDDVPAVQAHLVQVVGTGRPTLVLVDMLGGTPWNVALAVTARNGLARVVSGMNLPMLLELSLSRRGAAVDALARLALEAGEQALQVGPHTA